MQLLPELLLHSGGELGPGCVSLLGTSAFPGVTVPQREQRGPSGATGLRIQSTVLPRASPSLAQSWDELSRWGYLPTPSPSPLLFTGEVVTFGLPRRSG